MTSAIPAFLLLACFGPASPSLSAQETRPDPKAEATKAATPAKPQATARDILRVTSTDQDFVWQVLNILPIPLDSEIPEVGEEQQVTLRLLADKTLSLSVEKAGPEILIVQARPDVLATVVKEEAGILGRIFKAGAFAMLVHKLHAEPRYVARAVKAVTTFPDQIGGIELRVKRRKDFKRGLVIDFVLEPLEGAWLHKVIRGIEASDKGAHLMRSPDAALSLAAAIEGEGLAAMIAPFAENLACLRGKSKAERSAFREFVKKRVPNFDGTFSLLIDGPGRYARLIGLREAATYRRDAAGEIGQAFDTRRVGRPSPKLADEIPAALQGTTMQRMIDETDALQGVTSAPEEGAELATFVGVVQDFSLKVHWPSDGAEVARLVERISDRRLRRRGLMAKALLRAELNFGAKKLRRAIQMEELQEELQTLIDKEDLERIVAAIPEQVHVAVFKMAAAKLRFEILTR